VVASSNLAIPTKPRRFETPRMRVLADSGALLSLASARFELRS
jgi:hypothetical protein